MHLLPEPNQLAIQDIFGKFKFIDYEENETLSTLKEKIQDKEGIPPEQQHLYFGGEEIKDPLSKYVLKLGQTENPVYLRLSLR